ncbi:MAG: FAD:protein FMN transferase [Gammaproteobacteria bacterium]
MLAAIALVALAACSSTPRTQTRKFPAMGTQVDVTLYGVDKTTADRLMSAVEDQFHYMQRTWQPWHPGALARVNSLLSTTDWFSVAPSVRPLIVKSTPLSEASGNLFDPAIGKLIKLWGFNQDPRPPGPPPDPAKIAALVAKHPRMSDIHLDGIRIRSDNPAAFLDFGAYARGYGIDQTIDYLKSQGIKNAIINAGGDLRAIGRPGDRPWRVGIRNPRGPGIIASIDVQGDQSVFTSGDHDRSFIYHGTRYHHIIDPRTGYPARGTTSVTVVHRDAAVAAAAATALFVAGPKDWYKVARAMGIHYVMLVAADGTVYMNPAMAKRIHFETGKPPKVVLSAPL